MVLVHAIENMFRVGSQTAGVQLAFKAVKSQKPLKIFVILGVLGGLGGHMPPKVKSPGYQMKDMLIFVYFVLYTIG